MSSVLTKSLSNNIPVHSLLYWVKIPHGISSADQSIWWPCLLFDNPQSLYQYLKCGTELKAIIYQELLCYNPRGKGKIAFLLGYRRPRNVQTILVPADQESDLLRDFFEFVFQMDEEYGSNVEWKEAYDDANNRLLSSQRVVEERAKANDESDEQMSQSPSEATVVSDRKIALVVSSSGESVPSVTYPQSQPCPAGENKADWTTPKTMSTAIEKSAHELTPSPKSASSSIALKRHASSTEPRKRKIIDSYPWSSVWRILKEDYGYSERKGSGVVKLYFLTPQFLGKPLDYIRKHGHLERDYFTSEESIQRHVIESFRWRDGLEIDLLTDEQAWKRLSSAKYRFKYIQSFYCLPGVNPSLPEFRKGYDYFDDLTSLRRSLCAFSMPDDHIHKNILQDHELRAWITLAISNQAHGLTKLICVPLTFSEVWNILKKMGFKYGSCGYSLPLKERLFDSEYEMFHHLSRFGLPKSACTDNIDKNRLLALEMYLADYPEEKRMTWKRIPYNEVDAKYIRANVESANTVNVTNSSSISNSAVVRKKAEESDVDSPFSISSTSSTMRDIKDTMEKKKGKRTISNVIDEKTASGKESFKVKKSVKESVDVLNSTSITNSAVVYKKAEESDVDSPFSISSTSSKHLDIKVTMEKKKGKRVISNAIGEKTASGKESFKMKKSAAAHRQSVDKQKPSSDDASLHLSDMSFPRNEDDSEPDSLFSQCSLSPGTPDSLVVDLSQHDSFIAPKNTRKVDKAPKMEKSCAAQASKNIMSRKVNEKAKSVGKVQKSPSKSKHEKHTIDDDESTGSQILILTDEEAWARLKTDMFGFSCKNGKYCLPTFGLNECGYRDGYDSFTDLKSLRKNLCAYGIPDPKKQILHDEDLCNWICLAISSVAAGKRTVPPYEPFLNFTQAFSILQKIGFKYNSGVYHYPNKERSFDDAFELWHHLSRFGLPQTAYIQKIDEKTLLALELFLTDFPSEKRQIWRRSTDSSHALHMPVEDVSTGLPNRTSSRPPQESPRNQKAEESPLKSPNSFSLSLSMMDCGDSLGSLDSVSPCTISEQLQQSINVLSPSHLPDEIIFSGLDPSSGFAKQRKKVCDFLQSAIINYHNQDGKVTFPSSLYVCGGPGTGKTTTVNHCIKALTNENNSDVSSVSLYINCATIQSSLQLLKEVSNVLNVKAVEKIGTRLQKLNHPLIVVLDEIDVLSRMLFGSNGDVNINNLFSWVSDASYKFILIGISNTVGGKEAKKILEKFDEEVVFQPYTDEDMVAIINKRLGNAAALVEESAIKFATKKVSKVSGDVRQVLDIMKLACIKCLADLSPELQNPIIDGNAVVKVRHVMSALKDSGAAPMANIIAYLPQSCKSVLCVAVALQSCIPPGSVLTLSMLKKYCAEASAHRAVTLDNTSNETYIDIIRQLDDYGLLAIGGDIFFQDPSQMQLLIQCAIDDVECAMEEALFNQPFYRKLSEYIRKNKA